MIRLLSVEFASNTTEGNNFFTISYRIFENRRFFKKMYEIKMKQLLGELIKISTNRYSIARVRFCHSKLNSKAKKSLAHSLTSGLAKPIKTKS